jgi:hypothetical protein
MCQNKCGPIFLPHAYPITPMAVNTDNSAPAIFDMLSVTNVSAILYTVDVEIIIE